MYKGADQGYLPAPAKSLFIDGNLEEKEVAMRYLKGAGLNLNYVGGSQYLGAYLSPRKELETWVPPKVEAWDHGVCNLSKIYKQCP